MNRKSEIYSAIKDLLINGSDLTPQTIMASITSSHIKSFIHCFHFFRAMFTISTVTFRLKDETTDEVCYSFVQQLLWPADQSPKLSNMN